MTNRWFRVSGYPYLGLLTESLTKHFEYVPFKNTGFFADKDVRNMVAIKLDQGQLIFIANNNDRQDLFKVDNQKK